MRDRGRGICKITDMRNGRLQSQHSKSDGSKPAASKPNKAAFMVSRYALPLGHCRGTRVSAPPRIAVRI